MFVQDNADIKSSNIPVREKGLWLGVLTVLVSLARSGTTP